MELKSPTNIESKLIWSNYDFAAIPFDRIVRLGQRSMLYRDLFSVSWLLGRYCNYHCSYCWPHGRSDVRDHRPLALLIRTMDEIKRQSRERGYNSFHFSFSGGEPTLHPSYLDLLLHYAEDSENSNYQSVHMTTNLSAGLGFWDRYTQSVAGLHRVSITASWHREAGKQDPKGHAERFADKLVFLQTKDIEVTINMVMVPQWFDLIWAEALYFHERGLNVTLKPQSDPTASRVVPEYTTEQLRRLHNGMPQREFTRARLSQERRASQRPQCKMLGSDAQLIGDTTAIPQTMQVELQDEEGKRWYFDQAERFNAFNFNRFKDWTCESGYRSIIIREPDGNVKRSYSCHDKPLGNIESGFTLFDSPKKCITPTCVSSADSKIPKYRESKALVSI